LRLRDGSKITAMERRIAVIAHRTSPPYAPENSLEGIRVSFEQGADGVEIDLRMSLDLRAFLMHDNTMRRTTGWPLPIELTPSAIVRRQLLRRAAIPQSASPSDVSAQTRSLAAESPPTLDEAIDAVPAGKLLAVDVKTPWSIFALERAVESRSIQARTLAWCSSALVVRYAVRSLAGVEVAYYKDYEDSPSNLEFIGKAARIGAHAVSLDWRGLNSDIVAAAHALGLKVYSWHKDYPLTAEKLATGFDGLITDHPAQSRAVLDADMA
jgi:glycerophosphoryl diester phosphodiesterase